MGINIDSKPQLLGALTAILMLGGLFALLVNWVISYFVPTFEVSFSNWAMTWLGIIIAKIVLGSSK